PGQRVDISMQEAITLTLGNSQAVYALDGVISRRAGGGRASGETGARLVWPCRDGYVAWARIPATMPMLHRWMVDEGYEPGFDAELWARRPNAGPNVPPPDEVQAMEARVEGFFRGFDKMYLYEEGQRRGAMMCPVSSIPDLLANRQLVDRKFFQSVDHVELGRAFTSPGAPFRMSASPWLVGRAPALGEHTREVFDAPTRRPRRAATQKPGSAPDARAIFAGLRVVDFSWVGVGPLATQVLALFGAEVIRVESATRLDTFRNGQPLAPGDGPNRSAYWANVNRDKLGITLNLRNEGAADPVRRLVERADIVTESFSPGFMHEVGFDYEAIRAINPRAVMISMSMEGQGGPHLGFKGFGLVLQATAGITGLTGWPDRPPVGTGVAYTDWFATHLAVTAMISALEHRERTGDGQYIDLSQLEAMTWGLDDAILRYAATGEVMAANGNRHPLHAPHGVFRCAGDDRWCAITVLDDSQWHALRAAMGDPAWAADPALDAVAGRQAHEDEIEARLAAWTADQQPDALATRLQSAGVPAYGVADARDVQHDPQLAARGHFWEIEHPVIGRATWDAPAYRLSATPAYPQRPAPLLGEHNEQVYRELLGYSADELAELVAAGVLE
ncbi:MAG: CoA transferase, partial [Chloroflexi bacterium]|nr:CoA transferase [Chloroflexota bacterium]